MPEIEIELIGADTNAGDNEEKRKLDEAERHIQGHEEDQWQARVLPYIPGEPLWEYDNCSDLLRRILDCIEGMDTAGRFYTKLDSCE